MVAGGSAAKTRTEQNRGMKDLRNEGMRISTKEKPSRGWSLPSAEVGTIYPMP
jgi:hypothetical protein